MTTAFDTFIPEIQLLQTKLGFDLIPDEDGNCALQMVDDLVVLLTFSKTSQRYGMHCLLLCAPAELCRDVFVEALRLNIDLSNHGKGVLCYADETHEIAYTWSALCTATRAPLEDTLLSFLQQARELRQTLSGVRENEYRNSRELQEKVNMMEYLIPSANIINMGA